jgi:flagellar motor switch/type III secretory pathway protein FliN
MTAGEAGSPAAYLLLGDSRRRSLTHRLRQCVAQWRAEWTAEDPPEIRVELCELAAAVPVNDGHEVQYFRAGALQSVMVFAVPASSAAWMAGVCGMRLPYADRSNDVAEIAAGLELAAVEMLARRILAAADAGASTVEGTTARVQPLDIRQLLAARYVAANVTGDDGRDLFNLLISPALVNALLPAPRAVQSTEQMQRRTLAVADESVALEAVLGSSEVSVADLTKLAVGDVMVLNESLSSPAELRIRGGERVAMVSIGRLAGRRAIAVMNEKLRGQQVQ